MVLCPRRGTGWCGAILSAVTTLLARWWFANHPVRRDLVVAFIIVFSSPEGVIHELVAVLGSSVVLLVVEPLTTISSSGVVVLVGLANIGSHVRSHEPYPVVGGAVCPSRQVVFGRWFTVPVVTARRSCLVCDVAQG
jgi:hypothetical protein